MLRLCWSSRKLKARLLRRLRRGRTRSEAERTVKRPSLPRRDLGYGEAGHLTNLAGPSRRPRIINDFTNGEIATWP